MAKERHVVIIGAGLGGLGAAAALVAEGCRVTIYEKNDKVGGKLNTLTQDGYTFDLGPSIVTMPAVFAACFARTGRSMQEYITMETVDPHWRCFFPDGAQLDLLADRSLRGNTAAKLGVGEDADLDQFYQYAARLYKFANQTYFNSPGDTLGEVLRSYNPLKINQDSDRVSVMAEGVERYVKNCYLADTMNFFAKYVGSSPYAAPAVLNILSYVQWQFGLWYIPGGLYGIAQGLERLLQEMGVDIHLNTEVERIRTDQGRAVGVRLADGTRIDADVVVSNMEFIPAYRELLSEPKDVWEPLQEEFAPACSGLVLHLGVDCVYPQLAHHNFFFSEHPEEHFHTIFREGKLPTDPTIYLVAPGKSDPSLAPTGGEVIKVLPHIPHLGWGRRSAEEYQQLRERLLDKLEAMGLTNLRQHIVTEIMWTPEDIERLYYSNQGAIYGVVSDKERNLGFKGQKRSRLYDQLYFVGGSVNPGPGMPMALLSGLQTADIILDQVGKRPYGTDVTS